MNRRRTSATILVTVFGLNLAARSAEAQDAITRVSVDSAGVEGDAESFCFLSGDALSADGRFVVFYSFARNLVAGDTNNAADAFVHDRATGTTTRVSVDSSGAQGSSDYLAADSYSSSISDDGQVVAFYSFADNLVPGDTNGNFDVFVHELATGTTTRVSVDSSGAEGNYSSYSSSLSADGQIVAFYSYADNLVAGDQDYDADVFVHDRATGNTTRVSVDSSGAEGNADSYAPSLSGDGQIVAFYSDADNLVASDTNQAADVFVHDRATGATTRISVDSSGVEGNGASYSPSISADGRIVAFYSAADNLVSGDTNGAPDVFIHDRLTGITTRVSVDSSGAEGSGGSAVPSLSADGQIVAFASSADNLVPIDTNLQSDVFVHDRATGQTTLASDNCVGEIGNGQSWNASISGDGQLVAFSSRADNLVPSDTNAASDVFVRDRALGDTDASWNNYGAGFPGTLGIPSLTASADPVLGATVTIDVGNSLGAPTIGYLFAGLSKDSVPTDLGGTLLVGDLFLYLRIPIATAGASLSGDLPADPDLCGISLFVQVLELDAGAGKGVSFTPGLELVLGN